MEKKGKWTPLIAVKRYCLSCRGFSPSGVKHCEQEKCHLWIYRMGKNPARKGIGGNPNFGKK